jgi:hypothetical protein
MADFEFFHSPLALATEKSAKDNVTIPVEAASRDSP